MTETQTKIERGRKKRQRQIERDREKLREGTENRTISRRQTERGRQRKKGELT